MSCCMFATILLQLASAVALQFARSISQEVAIYVPHSNGLSGIYGRSIIVRRSTGFQPLMQVEEGYTLLWHGGRGLYHWLYNGT